MAARAPRTEEPATAQAMPLARLDPQALLEKALQGNAGIETIERLVALAKDLRQRQAMEAWHSAMALFQRDCPPIKRSKQAQIRTRTGAGYTYTYAPLSEILLKITPVMTNLGLSVGFRVKHETGRVVATARISHEMGHFEESGDVSMPIEAGEGGSGANPAQRVGIASTYAKRYALLAILGISPEDDPDGNHQGARQPIQQPQRMSQRAPEPEAEPEVIEDSDLTPPPAEDALQRPNLEGAEYTEGKVVEAQAISKGGKTRYGVKMSTSNEYLGTWHRTIGELAISLKGQEARAYWAPAKNPKYLDLLWIEKI